MEGSWVCVEGIWDGTCLKATTLLEAHGPRRAQEHTSDFHRLALRGVARNLASRARAEQCVREFLARDGFLEVRTPIVVPSPGLDPHLFALQALPFGYLITSPEYQMKRLLAGGLPRVFQITPCFRRDEQGAWHNPEFTMLEWYRAFASCEELMDDTERLVRRVLVEFGQERSVVACDREVSLEGPFERMTVAEAFARFASLGSDEVLRLAEQDEDTFFRLLVEQVEPALAARPTPVFLTRYPAPQASLARRCPDDPRWAERFELYLAGIELCNGFGELIEPVEQRARLLADQEQRRRLELEVYPIDERFLAALEHGMPPCSGNALGLDRLLALALGVPRIDELIAFPRDWL